MTTVYHGERGFLQSILDPFLDTADATGLQLVVKGSVFSSGKKIELQ